MSVPKHDNGFQGWRPFAYGDVWDKMSSNERRSAWRRDIYLGCGGAISIAYVLPHLINWIMK
jgi:hypothetical protein